MLTDLLAKAVGADPDAPALLYRDDSISFAALDRRSAGFAGALAAAGLRAGDRMFLCLQNVPEFVIALLGAARAGVITVPLNPMYRLPEIEKLAADCSPRAIVCEMDHAETVLGAALPGVHRFTVGEGGTFGVAQAGPPGLDTPCDLLMIVYTSGTTGRPKGAVVSHANLLAGAQTYCETARLQPGVPILAAAPLFHVTGLSGHIGAALAARAPLVLCHRFQADTVLDAIERHRPAFTVAAITALAALIDSPRFSSERVASLTTIFSGGAPIAPAMRDRVLAATGVTLRNAYGLTETVAPVIIAPAAPLAPCDPATGALSAGKPVPRASVRIVSEDGKDCLPGEAGEIVIKGPSVVAQYWRAPEETAAAMRAEGFRSGDVGVIDEAGWLYLVDRKKDMIVASGFKVWPREVEDVLYSHPAVREAAVVGIPDAYRGETVKAVVSLHPEAMLEPTEWTSELVAFCRSRMAAYKVPRHVEIRADLPKTATGKILRREIT
ncbi:AMP-binding protein [Novosphingobium sp.]|uniref:class I adenylate-forming enzyme family protein n=1 Tax=Novosphingobium sp. TaxID=1874826 RepID=UPI0031E2E635